MTLDLVVFFYKVCIDEKARYRELAFNTSFETINHNKWYMTSDIMKTERELQGKTKMVVIKQT